LSGFWLNETNQMKQINQINKTNQINKIDQTDRAFLRRANPRSSCVLPLFFRYLLESFACTNQKRICREY